MTMLFFAGPNNSVSLSDNNGNDDFDYEQDDEGCGGQVVVMVMMTTMMYEEDGTCMMMLITMIVLLLALIRFVRVHWLVNLPNYKDYNISLFHRVCTVTVRIFCSRCDA